MQNTSRMGVIKFTIGLLFLFISIPGILSCAKQPKGPTLDVSSAEAFEDSFEELLDAHADDPKTHAKLQMIMGKLFDGEFTRQGETIEEIYGEFNGLTAEELINKYDEWTAKVAEKERISNAAVPGRVQLRDVMIALHKFHDQHNGIPARFNQDASGTPLLSWRVHLLPFLGQQQLYEQFRFNEPWDSEHNIKLVGKMPKCYTTDFLNLRMGQTAILGTLSKNSIWQAAQDDKIPPRSGKKLRDIKDGLAYTAALILVPAEQAVIWTKPEDFDFDRSRAATKLKSRQKISVATAAATVFAVGGEISEKQWHLFVGTNDGAGADNEKAFSDPGLPIAK